MEEMFKKVAVGDIYEGKVVRIVPFGVFVEILPGKDGLVHVSQMATERVENPEDIVNEGQTVKVRVTDVDSQGKIALSMLFGNDQKPETEGRPRSGRSFGKAQDGFGGGDRPRPSYGNRPQRSGFSGERRDFGSPRSRFGPPRREVGEAGGGARRSSGFDRSRPGGFSRGGFNRGGNRDRGGRGGFNR